MKEYLFTLKRANGDVFTRRKLMTLLELDYFTKKVGYTNKLGTLLSLTEIK